VARRLVRDRIAERVAGGLGVVWATQLAEEIATAHRTVMVGGPCDGSLWAGPGARPRSVLARLRVLPRAQAEGPSVATDRRFELEIGDRGVTGITGPNGSGKTVLLWAAAGLGKPEQIQLEWIGAPVPPPIAALQFPELQVFEEDPLDEVTFAATQRGITRDAALKLARNHLRDLGLDLDDLARRPTWWLAGGEKRLLEVVAALISPSSLCALDEPTAGLDPARRAALSSFVARVSDRTAVLVASQDREWLRAVSARIYDLEDMADPSRAGALT
jgi:energy-coupling factor transporter ATP-binding protein EcfA2